MAKRQMSLGVSQLKKRLENLAKDAISAEIVSENEKVDLEDYEAMLISPGTGVERVGLISIIEKLTNATYISGDRDEDASLVQYMVERPAEEQDISPEVKAVEKTPTTKKKRLRKRKGDKAACDSPSIEFQSRQSSNLGEGSPQFKHFIIDKSKTVGQIVEEFHLRPSYQTIEGHESLPDASLKLLMRYAVTLAKDQGGCRFLQL